MKKPDAKRGIVYDFLIVLGVLILLLFVCRLWPVLLLAILGLIAVVIKQLIVSPKQVEETEAPPERKGSVKIPDEKDVRRLAYSVILRRITELVLTEYPNARWIFEEPNAKQLIEQGDNVHILLNRAGGYRKAKVNIFNLQVVGVEYQTAAQTNSDDSLQSVGESEGETSESLEENYGLLAFEWVEANVLDLSNRCNDAIGNGLSQIILNAAELPVCDSWADICVELARVGIKGAERVSEGIKINLMQEAAERE